MRDGKKGDEVKSIEIFTDKYGVEHQVYHNFDVITNQKAAASTQLSKFQNVSAGEASIPLSYNAGKNIWILKPACMSRGRGLELFTDLAQLNEFLKMYIAAGYDAKDYSQMKYSDKVDRSPSLTPSRITGNSSETSDSTIL